VARDPIRALLRQCRLSVRVVRRAEHRDEELDVDALAAVGVDDVRSAARVVDEALVAGAMLLAHRELPLREPSAVVLAEVRVAVPVGVLLEVLEVQQLERDAKLLPLRVDVAEVGQRLRLVRAARAVELRFELGVG
jgi:hypothetical protein